MLVVMEVGRRSVLIASFAMTLAGCMRNGEQPALPPSPNPHPPDPNETVVLPYSDIEFQAWGNLPLQSGEMAALYGDLDKPGPYLVMMKWIPAGSAHPTATPPTESASSYPETWLVDPHQPSWRQV
jgi:hypothetical protein